MKYRQILLIDDDEDDQEIFLSAVSQISDAVTCVTFDNASVALQKITAKEIIADVIFLDLNMPVMNGQQFLTQFKKNEELSKIPIIIFSTSSHSGTIQLMKDLGADGFITKPGRFDELVNLLKPLLS